MDPTDNRVFYAYTPNKVKHRKRTTTTQLKILEGNFMRETKPNAALRIYLAEQLNMTARDVQVWFQNRRAKKKKKGNTEGMPNIAFAQDIDSPSPHALEDNDVCESPCDALPAPFTAIPTTTEPSHLHIVTDSPECSWQGSPVTTFDVDSELGDMSIHMVHGRHGSLPASTSHPYIQLARANNNAPQRLSEHGQLERMHYSLTVAIQQRTRHTSMDGSGYPIPPSPFPSPLSPYDTIPASFPNHYFYPLSSRNISAPIPGPLPSPGFSFGITNVSSDSCRNSPVDFTGFYFPCNDPDTEDDGAASDHMSRFSSIDSESSTTSTYFSDVGSAGESPNLNRNARRESCPGLRNLMSGVDVNGPRRASIAEGVIGNYSAHSDGAGRGGGNAISYTLSEMNYDKPEDYSPPPPPPPPGPITYMHSADVSGAVFFDFAEAHGYPKDPYDGGTGVGK